MWRRPFPKAHWHRIRSTNGLERLHGEIKRRTNAVGAFPDRGSALRLVTAVALNVLGCWCAPLACHGHVLARIADAD